MSRYFTSDLHFGHKVITKYRPEFKTIEEHDSNFLEQFGKLNKRDIVFILGDFLFDNPKFDYYIEQISKMSCKFKLLMGNHDSLKLYDNNILPNNIELQLPLFSYKNYWLSHAPIHTMEIRNRIGNIHGHMHCDKVLYDETLYEDPTYFNVCPEHHNYKLVEFEQIEEHFKRKGLK